MAADTTIVRTRLRAAPTAHESSRERSLRAHPSNHRAPLDAPRPEPTDDDPLLRWDRLRAVLVGQGLSDDEARTEVARIATAQVWDEFADELRRHREAGRQSDANAVTVGLRSMQGVTQPILRHPGDVAVARSALSRARRRLSHNGGLLDRLHPPSNPLHRAEHAFSVLEAFLSLA
ncbi:hypothetical protein SCMU_39140 [Sinomonas cyclohexanicum]|uniref:Uncharacterized protein n=1 Tax=Sinomonas cyclohexanicum TaxID=322009 RepID=A0ABN6FRK6_SINCY|nr:hypothetical protein [Corynebacterium cyclohexanicum]BCT78072.1 hypothetical protein SCMU_39140 [Corynebacterium cyclohexanicum]